MKKLFKYSIAQYCFAGIIFILTIPLSQSVFRWANEKKLDGVVIENSNPVFHLEEWLNGKYQHKKEKFLNDNFGFRHFLVRCYNQLYYSLFHVAKTGDVIVGESDFLFDRRYLNTFSGIDFESELKVANYAHFIRAMQDSLKSRNVEMLLLIAPDKTQYYREYVPPAYVETRKRIQKNYYQEFVKYFKKEKVNLIDINAWFLKIKNHTPFPLFPQHGMHWSYYGACLGLDTLTRYIENTLHKDLPDIEFNTEFSTAKLDPNDKDLLMLMNLMQPVKSLPQCYPSLKINNRAKYHPDALVIGDSFYWIIYNYNINTDIFDDAGFWFYDRDLYPRRKYSKDKRGNDFFEREIGKQDIIILVAAPANLSTLGWGFFEGLYENFKKPGAIKIHKTEDKVYKAVRKYISTDRKWMSQIKQKAIERGISTDSMLNLDIQYVIDLEKRRSKPNSFK